MLKTYLDKLIDGKNLEMDEMRIASQDMLDDANPYQIAAFLSLLKAKGVTSKELTAVIEVLKRHMSSVSFREKVLDIVGTGGDGQNTVNISTGAAILAASCGAKIAKHGNRSASSKCGSADVLEKLGIDITMDAKNVEECLEKAGIAFMFAPLFHPAMKALAPIRKGMQISTIFNLIGPLLNPAGAKHLLIGVYDASLIDLFAGVLMRLNVERALIVNGNGLDELSCIGPTKVKEISPTSMRTYSIDPEDMGLRKCSLEDLRGGDAKQNAEMLMQALRGEESPIASTLILNAGAGLYVYGLASTIKEGVELAKDALQKGKAFQTLQKWRAQC